MICHCPKEGARACEVRRFRFESCQWYEKIAGMLEPEDNTDLESVAKYSSVKVQILLPARIGKYPDQRLT